MIDAIRVTNLELVSFLEKHLPLLSPKWWQNHVVDKLTFQQQRIASERGFKQLSQLDLAGLLRILDQNWYDLSEKVSLPKEARSWVKELQFVRNKWAHISSIKIAASDIYRDADTLEKLLNSLGSSSNSISVISRMKQEALLEMSYPDLALNDDEHIVIDAAKNTLPVTLFQVGDLACLKSNNNIIIPILEIISGHGERRYKVFENGKVTTYFESQIQVLPTKSQSINMITAMELHAHLTSINILSPSTSNLLSLRTGRVQFVPYQYRPVLKLVRSDLPRLLIADEVGVGKTIEAGLIISEMRARQGIQSILVICPKPLVSEQKWLNEMKRFDETFIALDGSMLRNCIQETHMNGEWPTQFSKAIVPFSLFDSDLLTGREKHGRRKNIGLLDLDTPPKFDLIIVDEAHHLRNANTMLHQGVRFLCDHAHAVLLLTATPVQLGSHDLYTLLNIIRPDLIIDRPSFNKMAEPNQYINEAIMHSRRAGLSWQTEAYEQLKLAADTEWGSLFLRESPAFQKIYDRLGQKPPENNERIAIIRELEELYTFSSLINRTRRRDIGEFTMRKPETITIEFTQSQRHVHNTLLDVMSDIYTIGRGQQNIMFMLTTIRRQASSCLYGLIPLLSDILNKRVDIAALGNLGAGKAAEAAFCPFIIAA